MSIWSDIQDRSMGESIRKEDAFVCKKENPMVPDLDARTSELLCNVDCFKCFSEPMVQFPLYFCDVFF